MQPPPREYFLPNPNLKLREQLREVARFRHVSLRTEQAYWEWIRRFIQFHRNRPHLTPPLSPPAAGAEREKNWRHPRDMAEKEVRDFLVHLALERRVAASTQNQALNALVFLYRRVLGTPIGFLGDFQRAHRGKRVREVLDKEEINQLLAATPAGYQLFFQLLYGTGMRLLEGLRLRVKDIDLAANQIEIHDGKGFKDRITVLPERWRNVQLSTFNFQRSIRDNYGEEI